MSSAVELSAIYLRPGACLGSQVQPTLRGRVPELPDDPHTSLFNIGFGSRENLGLERASSELDVDPTASASLAHLLAASAELGKVNKTRKNHINSHTQQHRTLFCNETS